MALLYETGNGKAKTSFAREDNNCVAFLCCGGPSLKRIDPSILRGPNRIVFGLNNTYPFIIPDIWVGMDDPRCYHRKIFNEPFIKIMRGGFQNRTIENGRVDRLFNVYYADVALAKSADDTFKLRAHDVKFVWKQSTITTALHIIVWMGCKKIYLFGNDLDNSKSDYHDESVALPDVHKNINTTFYEQVYDYLKWFSKAGKQYGVELHSCSEGSRAHDFINYVDYKHVIGGLEKDLPSTPELYHATEAEDFRMAGGIFPAQGAQNTKKPILKRDEK